MLLQGKLILWRCVFVTHLLVILVLGSFAWGMNEGLSLDRRRAEAFNVLVFGEIGYAVTTRFIKASTFHPRYEPRWLSSPAVPLHIVRGTGSIMCYMLQQSYQYSGVGADSSGHIYYADIPQPFSSYCIYLLLL